MEIISSMDTPGVSPAQIASERTGDSQERRRDRRHKVLSPAFANRNGSSQGAALELNEILNLSESGMCIQAPSQMKVNRLLPLGIDLSQSGDPIRTVGHVAWSEPSGKTGIRFPETAEAARSQLQQWLAANAEPIAPVDAWAKMDKEIEDCGQDLEAALHRIAEHALALTPASGTAVALINRLNAAEMICRARAGKDSPGIGMILEAGTGFSGECVRTAVTLTCDDAESDSRVDSDSCQALGIRSIVACPVKHGHEVIGILETFSRQRAAFREDDVKTLERLAGKIDSAIQRAERSHAEALAFPESDDWAQNSLDATAASFDEEELVAPPRSLTRRMFLLLIALLLLGGAIWTSVRWVAMRRFGTSGAATASPAEAAVPRATYLGADLKDLQSHADAGDAAAEYQLGMRYATGEDVKQDYPEALRWFLRAADQGDVHAQATVAVWVMAGRGATQDYSQAYYWALLAQAGGDEAGRAIVLNSAPYLSPAQTAATQKRAEGWLHAHHIGHAAESSR